MKIRTLPCGAAAPPTQFKTGSQVIIDTLRRLGVEIVFGYLGASVLPLFDCLYRQISDAPGFVRIPRPAAGCLRMAGDNIQCIRKTFSL